jgi:FG-GAP-like repeat/Abnormal spindle-like microcephaly-assoc'd, ASPM-SPD-2-Hydin
MVHYGRMILATLALVGCAAAGSAQFLETRAGAPALSNPFAITAGDFNGDGESDIAVGVDLGVSILLGNGDGTFKPAVFYPIGNDQAIESVASVDLRGNGTADLAVATLDDGVNVLLGNGDGTFGRPISYRTVAQPFYIVAGDFTNSGHIGIVALTRGSDECACLEVLPGKGNGTLGSPILTSYNPYGADALTAGTFNSGTNLDVAVAMESGFNIYFGLGNGKFELANAYTTDSPPGSIATASFRNNKILDLAVGLPFDGDIAIYLGNGDGTFTQGQLVPGSFASAVTTADLNGDGYPDLIAITGYPTSYITTYLGNGDGTFQEGVSYTTTGTPVFIAPADFNGDKKQDIALADYNGNAVTTMLNTGTVSFTPASALNFKKQAVGSTSSAQTVTLTNTGTASLKISAIKVTGQFGMNSTCRTTVLAGASCGINVTFSPKSQGAKAGTVSITDSASSKPMMIELSGMGTD